MIYGAEPVWQGPACDGGTPLVLERGAMRLEVRDRGVTVLDRVTGRRFVTPPDQVLAVTERGPVALFGDAAEPVRGACAGAAVRAALDSGRGR
ncbi:MAG: hypothetical protein JWP97_4645 [Labilithrix sp.]|nr:hypothetical protein [Labilithrix sp.]